jgi:hypothetical protein
MYISQWPIRLKLVLYLYNKERKKKSEKQLNLYTDGKSDTKG